MIKFFIGWLFNTGIVILLAILLSNILKLPEHFPMHYVIILIISWSFVGTLISKTKGDHSMLGVWLNPLGLISGPIGFGLILLGALISIPYTTKPIAFHLMWLIAPVITLNLILFSILPIFKKIPFLRVLNLIVCIELLFIYIALTHLYIVGSGQGYLFTPRSTTHYTLVVATFFFCGVILSIWVNILRSFEFYQKFEHNLDKLSKLDFKTKKQIACHEAGHALLYCYFKKLPEQMTLYLFELAMAVDPNANGLVVSKHTKSNTKEYQEWMLMCLLAGQRAELVMFSSTSQGASQDIAEWKQQAHIFLSIWDKQYFNQPENPAHVAVNGKKEEELFHKHSTTLDNFFKKNKGVLTDLANKAFVFKHLESNILHKFIKRVKITNGIPQEGKKGLF